MMWSGAFLLALLTVQLHAAHAALVAVAPAAAHRAPFAPSRPAPTDALLPLRILLRWRSPRALHKRLGARRWAPLSQLLAELQPVSPSNVVAHLAACDVQAEMMPQRADVLSATLTPEQARCVCAVPADQPSVVEFQADALRLLRGGAPCRMPTAVAADIDILSGWHYVPRLAATDAQSHAESQAKSQSAIPRGPPVAPADLARVYGFQYGNTSTPKPYAQAVVSFLKQYWSPHDLALFQRANGLPDHPVDRLIGPNDASMPGVEASLDVQFLNGMAFDVDNWVISTAGQVGVNEPWLDMLLHLATLKDAPLVYSQSYQDKEESVDRKYALRVSQEFALQTATGKTFITGSGDWGVGQQGKFSCDKFEADFPSSSPYVVSTGATLFTTQHPEFTKQAAVSFSSGGFSNYFPRPAFQDDAVKSFLAQTTIDTRFFNQSGRAFPDISVCGVGFQVFYQGSVQSVDGTSASTPLFASMISLVNIARLRAGKSPLGWVVPLLYNSLKDSTFFDVVEGQNSYQQCTGFKARAGFDPISGRGTPSFPLLLKQLLAIQ